MRILSGRGFVAGALAIAALGCDEGTVKRSQNATVTQNVGRTHIAIVYNRPVARGRALFGGLVPYGEAWNPGADEATTIAFSRDVRIDGQALAAGKYSIWVIPDSARWTFILSSAADVFHTPYPEGKDALRLQVTPRNGPHVETLLFYFPLVDSTHAELVMHWGETILPLEIVAPSSTNDGDSASEGAAGRNRAAPESARRIMRASVVVRQRFGGAEMNATPRTREL